MYFLSSVRLGALPQGLFFPPKIHLLYFINREPLFLCLRYINHVLSKLGATKSAPAGAFFPPKRHLLYFINREPPFLCLRYIQTQLLESKVAFRVHETLGWNTPADPADPADLPDWCHQVPLRPSLPHAPGVRMTAVTTNSLKLLNFPTFSDSSIFGRFEPLDSLKILSRCGSLKFNVF